jgi:hypothetical protein
MNRGVDPNVIQVFWAVPVQLGITADARVRIYPDAAPEAVRGTPVPEFVEMAPVQSQAIASAPEEETVEESVTVEETETAGNAPGGDVGSEGGESVEDQFDGKQAGEPEGAVRAAPTPVAPTANESRPRHDVQEELQKVLRVRRWDERASPFSGFDSPPGRF